MKARVEKSHAREAFLVIKKIDDVVCAIARDDHIVLISESVLTRIPAEVEEKGWAHYSVDPTNSTIYNADEWLTTDEWTEKDVGVKWTPQFSPPDEWADVDAPYGTLVEFMGTGPLGLIYHVDGAVWAANPHRGLIWNGDTPIEGPVRGELVELAGYVHKKTQAPIKWATDGEYDLFRVGEYTLYRPVVERSYQPDVIFDSRVDRPPHMQVRLDEWPDFGDTKYVDVACNLTFSGIHSQGQHAQVQQKYLKELAEHLEPPVRVSFHKPLEPTFWQSGDLEAIVMPCKE